MIDEKGNVYGRLTVIERDYDYPKKGVFWKCICECGKTKSINGADLRRGHSTSCGCFQKQRTSEASLKDLTGQFFGGLEILERDMSYTGHGSSTHWFCKCHSCGNIKSVPTNSLRSGVISCGCINSKGEYIISKILVENNINFKKEYRFKELGLKRFDFALFDENNNIIKLIEFDGLQHYYQPRAQHWRDSSSLEETQKRDKEKDNFCILNNIPLLRIPYWKIDKITIDMLLFEN